MPVISSRINDDPNPHQRVRPSKLTITYTGDKIELLNHVLKLAFHLGKDGPAITKAMADAPDDRAMADVFNQHFSAHAQIIVD